MFNSKLEDGALVAYNNLVADIVQEVKTIAPGAKFNFEDPSGTYELTPLVADDIGRTYPASGALVTTGLGYVNGATVAGTAINYINSYQIEAGRVHGYYGFTCLGNMAAAAVCPISDIQINMNGDRKRRWSGEYMQTATNNTMFVENPLRATQQMTVLLTYVPMAVVALNQFMVHGIVAKTKVG